MGVYYCAMLVCWESVVQCLPVIQEEHLEVVYFVKTVKRALMEMFPLLEMMQLPEVVLYYPFHHIWIGHKLVCEQHRSNIGIRNQWYQWKPTISRSYCNQSDERFVFGYCKNPTEIILVPCKKLTSCFIKLKNNTNNSLLLIFIENSAGEAGPVLYGGQQAFHW